MFVLAYEVAYEGSTVLGVYASLEAAKKAAHSHGFNAAGQWDSGLLRDLVIRQYTVDAEADFDAGDFVWSYEGE